MKKFREEIRFRRLCTKVQYCGSFFNYDCRKCRSKPRTGTGSVLATSVYFSRAMRQAISLKPNGIGTSVIKFMGQFQNYIEFRLKLVSHVTVPINFFSTYSMRSRRLHHGKTFNLFISTAKSTCKNPVTAVPRNVTNALIPAYHLKTLKATTGRIQARTNQSR
jgi:hypothetical protein